MLYTTYSICKRNQTENLEEAEIVYSVLRRILEISQLIDKTQTSKEVKCCWLVFAQAIHVGR